MSHITTRKLPKSSLVKQLIQFPSLKNRRALFCESRLERDALIELEFDKSVERYVTQPGSYAWDYQGKTRRYTPDILKQCKGEFTLVEVKPASKLDKPEQAAKYAALQQQFRERQGIELTLLTCADIQRNDDHIRREVLYPYLKLRLPREANKLGKTVLKQGGAMPIATLEQAFAQAGYTRVEAWTFLAKHYHKLTFTGSANLTIHSTITWSH